MTKTQFDKLIESNQKYIVKMGAEWCGPCKALDKNLQTILKNDPSLEKRIIKVDVDENPEIASELGVQSIPVTFYIKDKNVERKLGIQSVENLTRFLND